MCRCIYCFNSMLNWCVCYLVLWARAQQRKPDYPCGREQQAWSQLWLMSQTQLPWYFWVVPPLVKVLGHRNCRRNIFSIYQEEILSSANVNPRLKQKRDKQEMKLICLMELKG